MFKTLIENLMNFIQIIIESAMYPIDTLISNLFPDVQTYINVYNNVINNYIAPYVSFIYSMIPPITKSLILLYCAFLITLGTAIISYHAFTYIYRLVKAIKFW